MARNFVAFGQFFGQPVAAYLVAPDLKTFFGIWLALWVLTPIIPKP